MAMRLPLRWIAILRGSIKTDLAATSGIHRAGDVFKRDITEFFKMLMAGADVTMLCSILLCCGIDQIRVIEHGMKEWMDGSARVGFGRRAQGEYEPEELP
ncbi:MAG: hypothetical protein JO313_11890 [Verrucomicrobia bacterium]|nr:hypothetical protein [Verrucomicrobiota bacterium]